MTFFYYKCRKLLFLTCSILAIPSFASPDMVELKNGQMLETVILSEDQNSYTAKLNVGTIKISKDTVANIKEYAYDDNRHLLAKWTQSDKQPTNNSSQKNAPKPKDFLPSSNEIKYIRLGDRWITEAEYKEIKTEKERNWESKLEREKIRISKETEKNQSAKLYEATKELIMQGTARRSSEANRVLHHFPWKHRKTDHFLIFYDRDETGGLIENKAEFFLNRIATDLDIKNQLPDYLGNRIEIFVFEDEARWELALSGKKLADSPSGFSKIYKQEIFLQIENSYDIEFTLPHELAHILLRAYTDIQFTRNATIPLWLNEGFANYQGNIVNLSAAEQMLSNAIKKNNHLPLAELLSLSEYPIRADSKLLFYAEATKLVQFLSLNYGRNTFLDFLNIFLTEYNVVISQKNSFNKTSTKEVFRKALKESSLKDQFTNFTVFEEAWLKSILQ